ncbi:hypothetical protein [Mucilaginibacter flavus]|uniref:hypothetical protein n=1 Tax=Mucilaginibacter flavus TaxID=931504 RepID=UPI0025B5DF2A|nr:hypothetical protein [Mucilaginibacter flavus]MDN3584263.1 hypothetical protein [Mucilaginibacter flavus]
MRKALLIVVFILSLVSAKAQQIPDLGTITSFYQDTAANCASISVIKLAMAKYGGNGVFEKVDTLTDKYRIQFRDGKILELTKIEEAIIGKMDGFACGTKATIYKKARFIYAAMAKNKMMTDTIKYKTIENAAFEIKIVWLLFKKKIFVLAEDTEKNLSYLGLENLWISKLAGEVSNYPNIIITNSRHSAYSSFGFYDQYGKPIENSRFSGKHGGFPINEKLNYILKD